MRNEEGIGETLNTEVSNNKAQIKGLINNMKCMLGRMNSRLEEREEQISDLGDRVMERNQDEQEREKRMMENENRHRELRDSIKQ